MNTRTISIIFGIVFVLVGILGFVPNPLVAPEGIFAVNLWHNLVHILTGAAFLIGGLVFGAKSDLWVKVIGVAYLAVAILGFFTSGDMLLGLVHINQADRWLHLGLAIAILVAGFALPKAQQPVAA